jgi:hypothetical protein
LAHEIGESEHCRNRMAIHEAVALSNSALYANLTRRGYAASFRFGIHVQLHCEIQDEGNFWPESSCSL